MYVACSGSDSGPNSVFSTQVFRYVACCNKYYTSLIYTNTLREKKRMR